MNMLLRPPVNQAVWANGITKHFLPDRQGTIWKINPASWSVTFKAGPARKASRYQRVVLVQQLSLRAATKVNFIPFSKYGTYSYAVVSLRYACRGNCSWQSRRKTPLQDDGAEAVLSLYLVSKMNGVFDGSKPIVSTAERAALGLWKSTHYK